MAGGKGADKLRELFSIREFRVDGLHIYACFRPVPVGRTQPGDMMKRTLGDRHRGRTPERDAILLRYGQKHLNERQTPGGWCHFVTVPCALHDGVNGDGA